MAEKKMFILEYPIKASPKLLYNFLSSPSGLTEWFADDVNTHGDTLEFIWDDSQNTARIVSQKVNSFIRFQWEENLGEEVYFELKIQIDELTKDVSLIVTDFAEEDELEDAKQLWDAQIAKLLLKLGS